MSTQAWTVIASVIAAIIIVGGFIVLEWLASLEEGYREEDE